MLIHPTWVLRIWRIATLVATLHNPVCMSTLRVVILTFKVRIGLCHGCDLSPLLEKLYFFTERISRHPWKGVKNGGLEITILLFEDYGARLSPSKTDLWPLQAFHCWVWSSWDEKQHVKVRGHGSFPEKSWMLSLTGFVQWTVMTMILWSVIIFV